jgi:adenylosuccinate lyase
VHEQRMLENLELTYGAVFSQRVLTALLDAGLARDDAYRLVQELAQRAWDTRTPFRSLLESAEGLPELDLDALFDPAAYLRNAGEVFARLEALHG